MPACVRCARSFRMNTSARSISPAGTRRVRRCADTGGLARGLDPGGVRRLGSEPGRGVRDHGGDQPQRRQFRRVSRPDVRHERAGPSRQRAAEAAISHEDRERRAAAAVDGGDRADDGHRYDEAQDDGDAQGRPLRRERAEGLDLARAAFRFDAAARAHDAAQPKSRRNRTACRCSWSTCTRRSARA